MVKEQGERIFAQLNLATRQRLRSEGLRINEQTARVGLLNEAIEYGRSLVAKN